MKKKDLRRRSNWYIYLVSFAATVVLLGLVILALRDTLFPTNIVGTPDWRGLGNYTPVAELDVSVLFMMGDEQGSVPNNYMLLNYRPRDGVIVVVPINNRTRLRAGNSSAQIMELYRAGGAKRVIEGIENTFGVECEFYVHFDRSSFAGFISPFGEVEVNLPLPFSGGGITLPDGRQTLSGGDLFVYMNFVNFPESVVGEDYDLVVTGTAVTNLINTNSRQREPEMIQDAFNRIRNNANTNLTFRDYTAYQRALHYTSVNSTNPAIYYVPDGLYETGDFVVSNQSIANILNRFNLTGREPQS